MRQHRFGDFFIEVTQRRLRRVDGTIVPLTPRLFDALEYFVEHAGQLLDKDTLLAVWWPGLVVEENSLSQTVSALRRSLGDDVQSSRYIQTVPRRGFRFIAPVTTSDLPEEVVALTPVTVVTAVEVVTVTGPVAGDEPRVDRTDAEPVFAERPAAPLVAPDAPARATGRRRLLIAGATIGVAASTAGGAWWWRSGRGDGTGDPSTTLAILPFRPLVVEAGNEVLELGMADSLVARLSTLPGVVVRSVGAVRRYAGSDQDPMRAGRDLEVAWIVDGTIQRWGNQIRVSARLLDVRSGEAAWSGNFDESFTGVFDLQDAISTRVAQVLAPHLATRGQKRLAGLGGTRNIDAYQIYLAGRHQAQGIRTAGLTKSIALFQQAIALDPAFALAYVGLAESNRRMIFGADGEPRVVFEGAKRNAERAIALAPELAEGHSSVGWNRFWNDWDWTGAEQIFKRAIGLNANEVNAHFGYGQLLETLRRFDEARVQLRIARELDPQSLILLTLDAGSVFGGGKRDEGRARLQRVFDLEPDFWVAHLTLGAMLLAEGKVDDAIARMETADRLADGSSQAAAALGYALAKTGRADRARELLQRFADDARIRYVPPTSSGLIHAGLGDGESAMATLEQAYAVRDVRMTLVPFDGRWKLLHGDPRYVALMRRLDLTV